MKALRAAALVAASALVGVSLTACGGGSGSEQNAQDNAATSSEITGEIDPAQVKSSIVVGVDNPYYMFHHDLLVAQELGYFKEYGINEVTIKTTDAVIPAVIGGSLDFGLVDTDLGLAAGEKTGGRVEYIAPYHSQLPVVIGVGPGIEDFDDLKGKTIASGEFGSRPDRLTQQALRDNGIDPETDVKIVNTGGRSDQRLQSIIAGTVDAANLQFRHKALLEEAGGKFLYNESIDAPQSGWIVQDILRDSPETVAAFLAATLKARAYINDPANKQAVLDLMRSQGFEIPPAYEAAFELDNNPDFHPSDGGFDAAGMDKFVEDSIELETMPEGADWREYVALQPLWTAQANLGLPLHPTPEEINQ